MNIQFGATVFFLKATDFTLVAQVARQFPWLSYVEFRGEYPFCFPNYTPKQELAACKTILKDSSLKSTLHSTMYDINLATLNPWLKDGNIACYKKSIDLASFLESEVIVVHGGFIPDEFANGPLKDHFRELAEKHLIETLYELAEYGVKKQVKVAVENAPVEPRYPFIDSPESHRNLIESINHPNLGALIDIAHASLRGIDIPAYLKHLRPYLFEIHAHNNLGKKDDHLGLHHGVIDYNTILSYPEIRGIPFIMEIHSYEEVMETLNWLERIGRVS